MTVSGSIHFGNNVHASRLGKLEQLDKLPACDVEIGALQVLAHIVAIIHQSHVTRIIIYVGVFSHGSHLGQFRYSRNFKCPRFVVAKVQVKHVHLVGSYVVDNILDAFKSSEIAGNIEHKASVTEVGIVGNSYVRELCSGSLDCGNERLHSIEHPIGRAACNLHAPFTHSEGVALVAGGCIGLHAELYGKVGIGSDNGFIGSKFLCEIRGGNGCSIIGYDSHLLGQGGVAFGESHLLGSGENVVPHRSRKPEALGIYFVVELIHKISVRIIHIIILIDIGKRGLSRQSCGAGKGGA